MDGELIYEIDRLTIALVDAVSEYSGNKKPDEYSEYIIKVRDYIVNELEG